jgi:Fic family protein
MPVFTILDYIRKTQREVEERPKDYEQMLQTLEKEVRDHIGVEEQFKVYIETLHEKLEEAEREIVRLKEKLKERNEMIKCSEERLREMIKKYNRLKKELVVQEGSNKEILCMKNLPVNNNFEENDSHTDTKNLFNRLVILPYNHL